MLSGNPYIRVKLKNQWINRSSATTSWGRTVLELDSALEYRGPQTFSGVNWFSAVNRGIRIPYTGLYSINFLMWKNNEFYDSSGLWDDHHVTAFILRWTVPPSSISFNLDAVGFSSSVAYNYMHHETSLPWDCLNVTSEVLFNAGDYVTPAVSITGTQSGNMYGVKDSSYMTVRYIG